MDYMQDCRSEIEKHLEANQVDCSNLTDEQLDKMAARFYKNHYSYEMDEEFSARAAVSETLKEFAITIAGYELWIP